MTRQTLEGLVVWTLVTIVSLIWVACLLRGLKGALR